MMTEPTQSDPIDAVRAFNRFYTHQIGLLDAGLVKSPFSLTEARILYELANGEGVSGSMLGRELGLDAGYLSRVIGKLVSAGLVARDPSPDDRRQSVLSLTDKGLTVFDGLEAGTREQVGGLLEQLAPDDRARLVSSMQTIERLLGKAERAAMPYLLRPLRIGDAGWIVRRQGMLFAQEHGWDETFEAMIAEILSAFIRNFDPRRESAWIAERDGEIVGSVFAVHQSDEEAKLRMLYVEPSARGLGIGKRLVAECIAFARLKGYRKLTLWTNDNLHAARGIYQKEGFELVEEEPHHSFGKDLVGQYWELRLD